MLLPLCITLAGGIVTLAVAESPPGYAMYERFEPVGIVTPSTPR